jgi:hypothetical protein
MHKLFNSFCCSSYGCELWDLQAPALNNFCVAWRIALRRIWRLPHTSHSRPLPLTANCVLLLDCLCRRFLRFADSFVNSQSPLVSFVARHGNCSDVFHHWPEHLFPRLMLLVFPRRFNGGLTGLQ